MLQQFPYVTLFEAASHLRCDERTLIRLGVMGEVKIYARLDESWILSGLTKKNQDLTDDERKIKGVDIQLVEVPPHHLASFEAYPETAVTRVFGVTIKRGSDSVEALGLFRTADSKPIKTKECYLVMQRSDVAELHNSPKLQQGTSALDRPSPSVTNLHPTETGSSNRARRKQETQDKYQRWIHEAKRMKAETPTLTPSKIATALSELPNERASMKTIKNRITGKI
jgi:hypothetical protein